MKDSPDHVHHLDMCPTCDGLRVTRLERITGISSVRLDAGEHVLGGSLTLDGVVEMYVGPVVEACPDRAIEEGAP